MGCSASPCRLGEAAHLPQHLWLKPLTPGKQARVGGGSSNWEELGGSAGGRGGKMEKTGAKRSRRRRGAGVIGRAGGVKWVKHPDVLLNKKLGNKVPQPGPPGRFPALFLSPFYPLSRCSPSAVPQPRACDAIPRADTDGLIIDSRIILLLTFLITNISTPALKAYKEECFVCVLPSVLNTSFRLF